MSGGAVKAGPSQSKKIPREQNLRRDRVFLRLTTSKTATDCSLENPEAKTWSVGAVNLFSADKPSKSQEGSAALMKRGS
jgi:hypothetical protein